MAKQISYQDAGVNIDAGNLFVQKIKASVKSTHRPEVIGELGGFAGCFAPNLKEMQTPVLVSATDGVGTKLKLAIEHKLYAGIGIDLVAMCVNDLIVTGAEPLFFLDYYATAQLNTEVAVQVVESIANGCRQANVALIGGETAEMPGMYQSGDFDLAGFCVGIVDKAKIIDGSTIKTGDALIAISSSGVHSNGFSLVRKLLESAHQSPEFVEKLLTPTQIYVQALKPLIAQNLIKGAAHITGGGLSENIPRMLPTGTCAQINVGSWKMSEPFIWLQQTSGLPFHEFQRTFNCGVGMVLCVDIQHRETVIELLKAGSLNAWQIGHINESQTEPHVSFHAS